MQQVGAGPQRHPRWHPHASSPKRWNRQFGSPVERLPAPDAPPIVGARPRRLLRLRQELTGVRGDVDVGAAHDETDALTLERLTKRVHQRGQCRSARRLNDELC